jgi:hypothetical protein
MLFNEAMLKAAGHSAEAINALQQRQRGGLSGDAGYNYQRQYALVRLAELAASAPDATIAMEALCPVDDVVISHGDSHEHAQCKISATDTWTRNNNKLAHEFASQHALLVQYNAPNHRLVLVVTDGKQRTRLAAKAPPELKQVVHVVHMELPVPLHHHWTVARMRDALDALLPTAGRTPALREQLYKELNHFAGAPWQTAKVETVLLAIADRTLTPFVVAPSVRRPWRVTEADWHAAKSILGVIQGLTIDVSGDVCCYRYGLESGIVARCDTALFERFCHQVIVKGPATIEAFYEELPR